MAIPPPSAPVRESGELRSRFGHGPKVVIQIPCYNEAETLPRTMADLPRRIEGVEQVEVLVIDDGSTDDTAVVASRAGADQVIRLHRNQGLAWSFKTGLEGALRRGADVIVNTDGDNQYRGEDVARLVRPILDGEADIVIGARPIDDIEHFSPAKRWLQKLGTRVVAGLSHSNTLDAPSGFRAFSREAALRLNVFGHYTYTLETVVQAGLSNLRVTSVPVRVNPQTRPSRLIKSMSGYVLRGMRAILGAYLIYRPTRLFSLLSLFFLLPAAGLAFRYLYFMGIGEGTGHIQSVILAGVLCLAGVFSLAIGILAHLLGINRRLLEELRLDQKRRSLTDDEPP